ncbi:reverse transcriptase [Quillaja saponaria]|uniref:Reverse transcriptase n=1 Tax=Quillaja saponaria TaxID=32244 RepID=A0AAD7KNT6_QUISA|nr:reverse transcriptase [Quillaja saponaria]
MIAKYVQRGDVLGAVIKTGVSSTWRSILSTLDVVNFWLDKWVSMKPLTEVLNFDTPVANLDMVVADFIDDSGAWNRDTIDLIVPSVVETQNLGYPLSRCNSNPDQITWGYARTGCFSVKSCYDHCASSVNLKREFAGVWKVDCAARW